MSRGALLIISGRFIQALLTIAVLRLLTHLLSPAQVGGYYLMLSFASWAGLFLISPVGNYINRKLYGWHKAGQVLARFRVFNIYVILVSASVIPVVAAGKLIFGIGQDIPLWHFIAAVPLYVYSQTWNQTVVPALNLLGRRGAFVGYSVLSTALGLILAAGMVIAAGRQSYYWLYGQAAGLFLVYLLAGFSLRSATGGGQAARAAFSNLKKSTFSGLYAFAAPLSVSAFFMWMQTQSYRMIVERFAGAEFLGFLAVGLGISSSIAGVAESLVQQLYYPEFYRRLHASSGEDRRAALAQLADRAIPLYIVLTGFVFAMSPHLTRLLAAPEFHVAWKFAAVGAVIELFRMVTVIFSIASHAEMKTSTVVKPYAVGGTVTALAVLAACLSGLPGLYVPTGIAAGGLVTLFAMVSCMGRVSDFRIDRGYAFKSLVFSMGFIPALFLYRAGSLGVSLVITAVFGAYFLAVQWHIMSREKMPAGYSFPPDPGMRD